MNESFSHAPIQNGHVAEAIARHVLGDNVEWIGGRNPGYDFLDSGSRIDVKSGVRQQNVLAVGGPKEDCIGIHLSKGVDGLKSQDVDELMIVVRDGYGDSTSRVESRGDAVRVVLTVDVEGVVAYRLSVDDVARFFHRPFRRNGVMRTSVANVDARVKDLERYRCWPPRD